MELCRQVAEKPRQKCLTIQIFIRSKCLHGTDHLFHGTGQKLDLNFAGQKFFRLAGQIFVRLGWFRVNKTPKLANFRPDKNLTSILQDKSFFD